MPLNEIGQTINDKGNILCQKIGTKKTIHLSPHMVRNAELMRKQGWEVVMKPEAPPKRGNSSFSAGSYDEEKNQAEALRLKENADLLLKPNGELTKLKTSDVEINPETFTLQEFNEGVDKREGQERQAYLVKVYRALIGETKPGENLLGDMHREILKKLTPAASQNGTGNPGTNKPPPKKRGRKKGYKVVKKVTQDKPSKNSKPQTKINA